MTALREKKDWSGRKSWPCLVNSVEFSQKKVLSPTNGNLYAYAANNPVHYIDPDGRENETLINNENKVEAFLEEIKNNSENYSFDVYQRKALGDGKRNDLMLHSLFVITNKSTGEATTLSFNGTKLGLTSIGAWATNTAMDVDSYKSFQKGDNAYDMIHLVSSEMIDTKKTVANIINSINSSTTYFALDHKLNKVGAENCNTALFNTLSIKQTFPQVPLLKNNIGNSIPQSMLMMGW